jgi:hypothetical protein
MKTSRPAIKFRGGSFHALVVKPETPIHAWLHDIDTLLSRSRGFFAGKAVVIDVSADEGERFTPLLTREAHTFSQMRTDRGAPRTFSALCFPGWKQS